MSSFSLFGVIVLSALLAFCFWKVGIFLIEISALPKQWLAVQLRSAKATQVQPGGLSPRFTRLSSSSSKKSASANAAVEPKPMAERTYVGIDYSVYEEPTWKRRDIQLSF
jgi:hypothetical protein